MSEQQIQATQDMVDAILAKGHSANHDYFSKEKAKLESEFAAEMAKLETVKVEQCQRISKNLKHEYDQKAQREILLTNQKIVQEKQNYLEQVFQKSLTELKAWTKADYEEHMTAIFINNELVGEVEVIVAEYSQGFLTAEELSKLSQSQEKVTYRLSTDTIPNEGGFILAQGGIEYNFLFSSILAQVRDEKEFELAEALFTDGSD